MVAVSAGSAAKTALVAGAGTAQAVCVAKGVGMSILLGAGAWGLVIFGVIATAATYDYVVKGNRADGPVNNRGQKEPSGSVRSTIKKAFAAG